MNRIDPAALVALLQGRGFRAELQPGPVINSATAGIGFRIEFGNRPDDDPERFIDFVYVAVLQVPDTLPAEFVPRWNAGRRFARLQAREGVLALDMDVLLAGGVEETHVLATLEIWDRLLQLLVTEVRAALPAGA